MLIVLPNQTNGLPGLLNKLLDSASLPTLKRLFSKSTYAMQRFYFFLPKFILGGKSSELKEKLGHLGVNEVFTPHADLSGINGMRNLYINSVLHQAVIKVSGNSDQYSLSY